MSVDGPGANSQHMNERMSEQDQMCRIKEKKNILNVGTGGAIATVEKKRSTAC